MSEIRCMSLADIEREESRKTPEQRIREHISAMIAAALNCYQRGADSSALWRLVDAAGLLGTFHLQWSSHGLTDSDPTGRGFYLCMIPGADEAMRKQREEYDSYLALARHLDDNEAPATG